MIEMATIRNDDDRNLPDRNLSLINLRRAKNNGRYDR